MTSLVAILNQAHVALGWLSFALLAFVLIRRKGDYIHRWFGKVTITVLFAMATLAAGFVIYRLFGGQYGPAGFSILGVNKLAFPLYCFATAALFANHKIHNTTKNLLKETGRTCLLAAVLFGTAAALLSGNRPYLSGNWIYTFEINGSDFVASVLLPLIVLAKDGNWKFSQFSRTAGVDQHILRAVTGAIFVVYASAPWNHLTNGLYSLFLGAPGLGHVLLYNASPFIFLYFGGRVLPQIPRALRHLLRGTDDKSLKTA